MRIVSLIASATEMVCALGLGDQLVGRSHECDYPAWVKRLPAVTAPKFPTDGTSYEIDQRVKALLAEALSVYRVDADALRALRPDLVVTQTQCEVCAVSPRDVDEALGTWIDSRPRIVSLEPNALADVWADVHRLAEALGVPERGRDLVTRLTGRIGAVAQATARLRRVRVASIEWIDPLMSAGNWHPELVAAAGGDNLFGEAGRHSPFLSWEALVASDPEVILVAPCGFDLARTRAEMPILASRPGWPRLRAVRDGRVILGDGNQYFNRPGPRLVEAVEILAEILHPDRFDFGHEGTGWERYAGRSASG